MQFNSNYYISEHKEIYLNNGRNRIINKGNYCYFTSILQCLFNCIELSDYFLTYQFKDDLRSDGISVKIYNKLLHLYWTENKSLIPNKLLNAISNETYKYQENKQEDSHECLLHILSSLHAGLCYNVKINIDGEPKNDVDKMTLLYLESYKFFYKKNYSSIIKFFYGMYLNTYSCESCDFIDYKFEPFNTITVNLSDKLNISLNNFFLKTEKIEYNCSKCKNNNYIKTTTIWSLPNNIIIHLNKLDVNKDELINFPLNNLDFTPYLSKLNGDNNNYLYDLYAVNYHKGNIDNGHYFSCCRSIKDEWIKYEDDNVVKMNKDLVNKIITNEAYILFYRRKFVKV
jgi:ubiquitin C-terminal hydrolase